VPHDTLTDQLNTITANELFSMDLQPQRQVVTGLVTVGLNILAGAPKSGKSFAVLQMAHAVAEGRAFLQHTVTPGRVVYLALEDTLWRIRNRMRALKLTPCDDLSFAIFAPALREGGLEQIHNYLQTHHPQLLIIDTLARVRGARQGHDIYLEDSSLGAALQSVALAADAAVLVVHHQSKVGHDDFLLSLSGSAGLPAAADVVMVLERERNATVGRLLAVGRDIEEKEIALRWSGNGWARADSPHA